jgi:hypothetical protein
MMEYNSVSNSDAVVVESSSSSSPDDLVVVGVVKEIIFEYFFSSDDKIIFRRVHGRLCLSKTSAELVDETSCCPAEITCSSFVDSVMMKPGWKVVMERWMRS